MKDRTKLRILFFSFVGIGLEAVPFYSISANVGLVVSWSSIIPLILMFLVKPKPKELVVSRNANN